jgi:hypothetical protein
VPVAVVESWDLQLLFLLDMAKRTLPEVVVEHRVLTASLTAPTAVMVVPVS